MKYDKNIWKIIASCIPETTLLQKKHNKDNIKISNLEKYMTGKNGSFKKDGDVLTWKPKKFI